jgi:hypothetical protein
MGQLRNFSSLCVRFIPKKGLFPIEKQVWHSDCLKEMDVRIGAD